MLRKTTCLLAALTGSALAQKVAIEDFEIGSLLSFDVAQPQATFDIRLPAAFPKPSRSVPVAFDCEKGFQINWSDEDDRKTVSGLVQVQAAPLYTTRLGNLHLGCPGGRLQVSHPDLWRWLTADEPNVNIRNAVRSGLFGGSLNVAVSKDRKAFALGISGDISFTVAGGNLKVMEGEYNMAASASQGGTPKPLWVAGGKSGALAVDVKKPFNFYSTNDSGKSWTNVTFDLGNNTLTLWRSKTTAGGNPPTVR